AHRVVAGAEAAADDHGELRHVRTGDRGDHLRAVLGDAGLFVFLADHEAGDVLQEHQGNIALGAQSDEVRALERGLGEQYAVVRDNPDWIAIYMAEAADQGLAVARLEFLELRTVDDARDDLANVERPARVGRQGAVDVFDRVSWFARLPDRNWQRLAPVELGDDVARDRKRMRVVLGEVVGHAGN